MTRGLGYLGLCSVLTAFEQGEIACFDMGPRFFGVYARHLRLLNGERSLALTRDLGYLGLCSVLSAFEQGEIACCDTGPRLFGSHSRHCPTFTTIEGF